MQGILSSSLEYQNTSITKHIASQYP